MNVKGIGSFVCCSALLAVQFSSAFARSAVDLSPTSMQGLSAGKSGRPWTPRDSIAVRYFATEDVAFAPRGDRFFFVSYHGEFDCDCTVYELSVFDTLDVRRALDHRNNGHGKMPLPLRSLVRRSSGHVTAAIADAAWEDDGDAITFQGSSNDGIRQLYRFETTTGKVIPLTQWKDEVYSMDRRGETVVGELYRPLAAVPPEYPVHPIDRADIYAALDPTQAERWIYTFVSYRGGAPWEVTGSDLLVGNQPLFSESGSMAIQVRSIKRRPTSWSRYDSISVAAGGSLSQVRPVPQFFLIDAEHQRIAAMFDAPAGSATNVGGKREAIRSNALWAQDQRHVVLVNTSVPVSADAPERERMSYVVGYDVVTGRWSIIEPIEGIDSASGLPRRVSGVTWAKPGTDLLISHHEDGSPDVDMVYTLVGDRWEGKRAAVRPTVLSSSSSAARVPSRLSVELRQSANEPPMMVASDSGHEVALTRPDPALAGLDWARTEPFQWREPSGKTAVAGLLLPQGVTGAVPLVIQAYTYEPERFAPDGPAYHAYAAQALVAKGMAVLNVNIPGEDAVAPGTPTITGTPREGPAFSERVESVTAALAERGLIDPARVGVVGFSRGGFDTNYLITHPGKHPPAAAVIDDAYLGTYPYYLTLAALDGARGAAGVESLNSGSFWQKKGVWLQNDSSFNTDRVETPALFTIHSQSAVLSTIETIGAYALNRRPLEYLVFPDGKHQLSLPRQRVASQEATIDWMEFWLQGNEDSKPSKAAQYARWRAMRSANDSRRASSGQSSKLMKGHWVFVPDVPPG